MEHDRRVHGPARLSASPLSRTGPCSQFPYGSPRPGTTLRRKPCRHRTKTAVDRKGPVDLEGLSVSTGMGDHTIAVHNQRITAVGGLVDGTECGRP